MMVFILIKLSEINFKHLDNKNNKKRQYNHKPLTKKYLYVAKITSFVILTILLYFCIKQ